MSIAPIPVSATDAVASDADAPGVYRETTVPKRAEEPRSSPCVLSRVPRTTVGVSVDTLAGRCEVP